MIRSMLQAVLCLILCPLLVAQQVAGEAPQREASQRLSQATAAAPAPIALTGIPEDTKIGLTVLDSVSPETAKAGSYVLLAVARNVVVNGVTVLRAGTCMTGTITCEKNGSHAMNRDGNLTIRAWELQSGRKIRLRVKGLRSENAYAMNGRGSETKSCIWLLTGIGLVVLALIAISADSKSTTLSW
jgi:hypothetical protein